MQFGNAIRIQRVIKGYSQEYMASRLNISQNAYSKLEREETELSVKRAYEIAAILEVSVYLLLPDVRSSSVVDLVIFEKFVSRSRLFLSYLFN